MVPASDGSGAGKAGVQDWEEKAADTSAINTAAQCWLGRRGRVLIIVQGKNQTNQD